MALLAVLPLSLRIEAGGVGTRTLGVDFGLRRTGLALSSGFAPLPLRVVPCEATRSARPDTARVARAAAGEGAAQIVLGMPLNSTGGEGEQAGRTRDLRASRGGRCAAASLPVGRALQHPRRAAAATATHGVDVAAAVTLEELDADRGARK